MAPAGPTTSRRCRGVTARRQLSLDHLPLVQQSLEARHGAATFWGWPRILTLSVTDSLRPAAVAPSHALPRIRGAPA